GRTHAPRPVAAAEPSSSVEPWWNPLLQGSEARLDPERRRALQEKRNDHAFACLGRVAIEAASDDRIRALAVGIQAGLRVSEAPGVGVKLLKDRAEGINHPVAPWR